MPRRNSERWRQNIKEREAILKEYMTEMGPRKDPWHRSETDEPDKEAGKAKELDKETENRQAREASTDEELKPMHPKDTMSPTEFDGARKDFMPWHESFT